MTNSADFVFQDEILKMHALTHTDVFPSILIMIRLVLSLTSLSILSLIHVRFVRLQPPKSKAISTRPSNILFSIMSPVPFITKLDAISVLSASAPFLNPILLLVLDLISLH